MTTFTPDASRALGGPDWLVDRRIAAAEHLADLTWPSSSEEIAVAYGHDRSSVKG